MQPVYVSSCIDSVQKAVKQKIDAMKIVADQCKACSKCQWRGFRIPAFVNNSCPIPTNVGGILTKIFGRASSILGSLETDWAKYREDAIQKLNYLDIKIGNVYSRAIHSYDLFSTNYDYLKIDWDWLTAFKRNLYGSFISARIKYWAFYDILNNFNNYFMNETDKLIINSNKKLTGQILKNWNNVQCVDGALGYFLDDGNDFVNFWKFYMSSLFYIVDIDAAISAAFVQVTNFTFGLEACVDGVTKNSNKSVKMRAESCFNQVFGENHLNRI